MKIKRNFKYLHILFGIVLIAQTSCAHTEDSSEKGVAENKSAAQQESLVANASNEKKEAPFVQKNKVSEKMLAPANAKEKSALKGDEEGSYFEQLRAQNSRSVDKFCKKVNQKFLYWGWGKGRCHDYQWHHVRNSVKGDPLIWSVFGKEGANGEKRDTTLILCGVHGDEITPIKFCFDIVDYLNKNWERYYSGENKLVVVAPIVSPDSFFTRRPSRTNSRKVDLNRNFPTQDWWQEATKLWAHKYRKDPRRNPGVRPGSEPEVVFQINLIKRYDPSKIISVHAPLTMLDYDGPENLKEPVVGKKANQLLLQMSHQASGYRIRNYPFFPGSLGNWAGNERGIPTYTLELPSSDNRKSKEYWEQFKGAIHAAILSNLSQAQDVAMKAEQKALPQ